MDDQMADQILRLCGEFAAYVNRPEAFTPEQTREAVRVILHRLLELASHKPAAAAREAAAE